MLEAAIPSLWCSLHSWFTPTVLFILLNLVIGTIAVTSKSTTAATAAGKLSRSPSLVLERLKSFNLYTYKAPDIPTQTLQTQEPVVETVTQETVEPLTLEPLEPVLPVETHPISRSQSDTHPTAGKLKAKLPVRLKKSASVKSPFSHFEEQDIVVKRPETSRPAKVEESEEGDEVDAKADDFINRFRQQLKLQRLESIIRYKDMITRGSST